MNFSLGVAIATCNGEKYIADQLNSIVTQSCGVDFVSISDDASDDNTVEIVDNILRCSGISYKIVVNNKRVGVINNFLQAFSACDTDYIAYCDQDDVWDSEKIKLCKNALSKSDVSLIFHESIIVDSDLKEANFNKSKIFNGGQYKNPHIPDVLFGWGHQYIFSKEVFYFLREMISFDKDHSADFLSNFDKSLLYAAGMVGEIVFIDKGLTYFRRHAATVSNAGKSSGVVSEFSIGFRKKFNFLIESKSTKEIIQMERIVGDLLFLQNFILQNNSKLTHVNLLKNNYFIKSLNVLHRTQVRLNIYTSKSFMVRLHSIVSMMLQGGYGSVFENKIPIKYFIKDIILGILSYKRKH